MINYIALTEKSSNYYFGYEILNADIGSSSYRYKRDKLSLWQLYGNRNAILAYMDCWLLLEHKNQVAF